MAYPIIWVPASSEDYVRGRSVGPIIAIVHHRMVGTLPGTDSTFQSSTNRPVSTHFGIGYENGRLEIHQYVDLSDTAFGNGNYDSSGSWDNWGYPISGINARTVSIEHQDNAHLPSGSGKGIVPEAVIQASFWLDRLITCGDITKIRNAGIRVRSTTTVSQLHRIKPGSRTLITHNDIAGRLKPSCWKPWADDKVGYPRSRFVAAVSGTTPLPPMPDTATEGDDVRQFGAFIQPRVVFIPRGAVLYDNEALAPSSGNIIIDPGRDMPYVGSWTPDIGIVAYVPTSPTSTGTKTYWVKREVIEGYPTLESKLGGASDAEVAAAVKAATDPLKATITGLQSTVSALQATVADLRAQVTSLTAQVASAVAARDAAEAARLVAETLSTKAAAFKTALRDLLAE